MGGQVVRARKGDRGPMLPEIAAFANQRPGRCRRGLFSVSAFSTLYVADLDAIQRHGDNFQALRRIRKFPALQIWIDNGAADGAAVEALVGAILERRSSAANRNVTAS